MQQDSRHTRPVTLKDVAHQCGVTVATVSNAFHRAHLVKAETRDRILAAARELGYDPAAQHMARRMRLSRDNVQMLNQQVALILPPGRYVHHDYYYALINGVIDALVEKDHMLITYCIRHEQEGDPPAPLPRPFFRGDLDAVIILAEGSDRQHLIKQLEASSFFAYRPIVTLMEPVLNHASVVIDDYRGGYAIVDHLLGLGHRQLLHFFRKDDDVYQYQQRLAGMWQACCDRAWDPNQCLHFYAEENWTIEDDAYMRQYLSDMFVRHPRISAIVARNDREAFAIARMLRTMGMRIPDAMSLTGFDDVIPLHDDQLRNILTTVRVPLREIGYRAGKLAVDLSSAKSPMPRTEMLPVELVVRGSTGSPWTDDLHR